MDVFREWFVGFITKNLVFTMALISASAPVWAINKCIGSDGRPVFQDATCAGKGEKLDVRPAAGSAPVASVAPGAKPMTEADRLNALSIQSATERRKQELRDRLVPDAQNRVYAHRQECAARQKELEAEKYRYVQNMRGTVERAATTSDLAAVAATCDTKDREYQAQLEAVKKECVELKCSP